MHEIDLPVETVKYWSDSTLVLQYIHNKRLRLKVFTSNRTSEIHRLTEEKDWGHIDGGDNPADILSRGVYDPEELLKRDWFEPKVLMKEEWDGSSEGGIEELDEDDPEVKKRQILVAFGVIRTEAIDMTRIS